MPENTIWKHILNALRETWAKETFAEWTASADPKFVSFNDNSLIISCKSSQAAISTKLTGHEFEKILRGMGFDQPVVKFVPEDAVMGIKADPIEDVYQQIVKPDRALYLPGYFKRWLRQIGPELAWMYASFRQAAYLDGGRSDLFTGRITGAEIAARAGIGERTHWERVENPATWEKLKGLVSYADQGAQWDLSSGKPRRMPRNFSVAMTLPLTPIDSASLAKWLGDRAAQLGGAEKALRAAADTPVQELIPLEAEASATPVTVRALAREMFGKELDANLLNALASALHNHIMPTSDQIKITLYFMQHILPHLGASAGWMLTLLRDRCFSDGAEMRNHVIVQGGYAEIAAWLGMSGTRRARTVWDWLNARHPSSHADAGCYRNPACRIYLREEDKDGMLRDFENQPRVFSVLLEEIPREMLESILTGEGFTASLIAGIPVNDATCSIGMTRSAQSIDAFRSIAMTRLAQSIDATCSVKSSLALNPNTKTPPTQPVQEEPASPIGRAGWSFSQIAQNNSLNPKGAKDLQKRFADEQVLALKFLAWILYAYSPLGRGLNDTTGVSKAVKSLCSAQPEFAPQKFERLAKLGPRQLQDLFDRDYARADLGKSVEARIYASNFKKLDAERKSDLYFALFGLENPEPAPKPKPEQTKTAYQIRLEEIKARKRQE